MNNNIQEELALRAQIERTAGQWNAQLAAMRSTLERRNQQNQSQADMRAYITRRTQEVQNEVAPELIDYIGGSTVDEVEQSIAVAKQKTTSILDGIRHANQQQFSPPPPPPTQPDPTEEIVTFEDLVQMTPQSPAYQKLRARMGMDKDGRGHGLYG